MMQMVSRALGECRTITRIEHDNQIEYGELAERL